jgi:phosphoglycerate dehydrogenase-like enzyme
LSVSEPIGVPAEPVTVLVASYLEPEHVERIASVDPAGVRVRYEPGLLPVPKYPADHDGVRRDLGPAELARWEAYLAEADVLFDFDWLDPERLPENAPRVGWVQATSSGIGEFVARTGLDRWSATLTTAGGTHAVPLAEFVVLGLLYLTKDVPELRRRQHAHHWERYTARQLAGRRALVIGLGHVGRKIAETLAALGLEVWGMRRESSALLPAGVARGLSRQQLPEALGAVDALVLACPYTPETHHLIGRAELARLQPGALLVNVARGAVVDEPALIDALREGRLGGAVLDVFEQEPLPVGNPLWDLPNVLVSPHSASTVEAENEMIVDLFIDNLRRYLARRPLRNVFDHARQY